MRSVHGGERPHVCGQCGFATAKKANLKRHVEMHTGLKAHSCGTCGVACTQKGSLVRHMKTASHKAAVADLDDLPSTSARNGSSDSDSSASTIDYCSPSASRAGVATVAVATQQARENIL